VVTDVGVAILVLIPTHKDLHFQGE
jgi:hypothetical protein